jgi:protein-S-isoprenylcysteine O-methyltransferase Ste14
MTFTFAILALWLVFYAYWLISALTTKRSIRTPQWRTGRLLRFLLIIVIFLLFRLQHRFQLFWRLQSFLNPTVRGIGVILCFLGFAFAVWARMTLGRNWGEPMSLKEGHELVTNGPYSVVRHPIYAGILLATLGTTLAISLLWFIVFILFCPYFVYSARTEEQLMMQQFPHAYPEYMKRTKALIPFVW